MKTVPLIWADNAYAPSALNSFSVATFNFDKKRRRTFVDIGNALRAFGCGTLFRCQIFSWHKLRRIYIACGYIGYSVQAYGQ